MEFDTLYRRLMESLINEKVFGAAAWIYHRTRTNPETGNLHLNGINNHKNEAALYGKGLYGTSFLSDQLTDEMKNYGKYIIKGKVNLSNMLIVDKEIFEKYRPNDNFEKYLYYEQGLSVEEILHSLKHGDIYAHNHERFYLKKDGLFYKSNETHTVVIWNPKIFIASSYSENDGKSWKKLNPNIKNIKNAVDDRENILKDYKQQFGGELTL